MKNLIGITCYPVNDIQVKMLNDCIDSLKPLGFDIMVLSHYSIDMDIQKKVNFVHYDSDNSFLPSEMAQHNFLITNFFESKIFNGGHSLAISKNINTLFNFAQNMDYDYCICVEFDCKFNEDDILKISKLIDNMKLLFTAVSKSFSSPKNPFSSSVPSLIAVLYGFSPLC